MGFLVIFTLKDDSGGGCHIGHVIATEEFKDRELEGGGSISLKYVVEVQPSLVSRVVDETRRYMQFSQSQPLYFVSGG